MATNQGDLTGRSSVVSNVLFNWLGHGVFVVAGFILPRAINDQLGQELLGIWDFAWSLISYLSIAQGGIASSVNPYVAQYRTRNDLAGINRIVSAATILLCVGGLIVLLASAAFALSLPYWVGEKLGSNLGEAQRVVFFLGVGLAIEISMSAFHGVLTGYHRWGLQQLVKSGWHAASLIAMVVALLLGSGLDDLAVIVAIGLFLDGITRALCAFSVCGGLKIHPSLADRESLRQVFVFGGKTLIPTVSNIFHMQTTSVLILYHLGPAALALFARPRSLIIQVGAIANKLAVVISPVVSSQSAQDDLAGMQDMLIKAAQYSVCITLPIILIMVFFGSAILQVWMGDAYSGSALPAILATGFFAVMIQRPSYMVLSGLKVHGIAGLAELGAAVCSAALVYVVLGVFNMDLIGVAVAATLPLAVINLTYIPYLVCRRLELPLSEYWLRAVLGPVRFVVPFAIPVVACWYYLGGNSVVGLLLGGGLGGLVSLPVYWYFVFPQRIKSMIMERLA